MAVNHLPDYYKNRIKILEGEFIVNINELTQIYPYSKTYSTNSTYASQYSKDKGSVDKTRSKIFLLKDQLMQDINRTSKNGQEYMKKINKIEKDNLKLTKATDNLDYKSEGAIGMYEDSRELYNFQLLENWLLMASLIILSYRIYKI